MIGTLWVHLKTSHLYVIVGDCQLEATNRPAVLYRLVGGEGPVWARDMEEFMDGRFAEVSGTLIAPRNSIHAPEAAHDR